MRSIALIAAVLSFALPVSAQPIHGHPQKTAYASPAEWPTVSAQGHWGAPGLSPMPMAGMPAMAHTHVDLTCPVYAELSAPVVCRFAVKLFETQGHFGGFYTSLIRDIVWDETGSATVPVFVGDPHGLVVKTGHLTVDLAMPTYYPNVQHGWVGPYLTGVTGYDNGDSTFVQLSVPFWSMLDPSVPELPIGNGGGPVIRTMVEVGNTTIFGSNTTPINYGETIAEYGLEANEFIPLAPISAPWTLTAFSDGYGSADLPEAVLETRLDLDLHNNVPGTVILSARGLSHLNRPVVFDPTLFAASTAPVGTVAGKHKVALFREQTDGPETVMALLVIDVAVGDGTVVTPPSLCTDPAATNQGQPLPCVFPPPPVLTVFTFTCDAAGKCTVVIR